MGWSVGRIVKNYTRRNALSVGGMGIARTGVKKLTGRSVAYNVAKKDTKPRRVKKNHIAPYVKRLDIGMARSSARTIGKPVKKW